MSDIFISYASGARQRVQLLAHALEKKGWSVWWDRRIPTGQSFPQVIQKAIDGSKVVVVVWTKTSVTSDWVRDEAQEGMDRHVLFPVMIEEVKIPIGFRHVHAARLMDWQPDQDHAGFDQFIDDLVGVIGAPVTPRQTSSVSSAKPTSEPEIEPSQNMVRVALSGNDNLSELTLSPGTLEPTFAAITTDYTVNVASDVPSVNITAIKADPDAVLSGVVTIGSGTATGQATIQLNGPGTTTLAVITVTAPKGSSKTYRITVNRAAPSGNNSLFALTVSSGTLSPAFNANTLSYTMDVTSTVTSLTVRPSLQDTTAAMTVNGQATQSGQARTIVLSGPGSNTLLTIAVTAPNGAQKTYRVNISRAALGGNNNLQSLSVSPGILWPPFSASRTAYTVDIRGSVTSIAVAATLQDTNSNMTINGEGVNSAQTRSISLDATGSRTEIEIIVTAPNGSSKIYLITVSRAALPQAAEAEPEPVRREPELSALTTGAANSDSPRESFRSYGATGVWEASAQVGEDPSSPSTVTGQSTESLPYIPIGIGLLAAFGALVSLMTFSQGPSPQYQPAVQAPMVLVPAGEFTMGAREDDESANKEMRPAHLVYLDAFYIDQYEVTTSRYATFFQETKRSAPEYWSELVLKQHGNKPVVGVDWHDATSYCTWGGKRLPTEAEWEKAARGTDQRPFPWGNARPDKQLTNFLHWRDDFKDYRVLTDVGSYEQGKSPYGVYDMAGNVSEWVADWYDVNYYAKSPERNPKGPSTGEYRVLRGGSWYHFPVHILSAYRLSSIPTTRRDTIGFRCAQDAK